MAPKGKNQDAENAAAEEARKRAEAEDAKESGGDERPEDSPNVDSAGDHSAQQGESDERLPTEIFAVEVNPKLSFTDMVEIEGKHFYRDSAVNQSEGTAFLNDIEYERISQYKDPEYNVQYVVKQKGGNS